MLQPLVLPILHSTQKNRLQEAPLSGQSRTVLQRTQMLPLTRRASDPNIHPTYRASPFLQDPKPITKNNPPPNARADKGKLPNIVPRPQTPALDIKTPPAAIFVDTENGKYGIRCICGNQVNDGKMIQCSQCGFWVHAMCVNLARVMPSDTYLCPFCKRRPLRCKCGNAKKYDEPIIQCPKCKYWAHKSCLLLGYGRIPPNYCCNACGGYKPTLPPIEMIPESGISNIASFITTNRSSLVQQIPDGSFKNAVVNDLNKGEISLYDMMTRYFKQFVEHILAEDSEFWRCFTETMMSLFECSEKVITDSLDYLANQLIYKSIPETPPLFVALNKFSLSERVSIIFEDPSFEIPNFELSKNNQSGESKNSDQLPKLVRRGNGIFTENPIEDGGFICEIPGFLCYYTEMPADEGLLKRWISIPDSDFVIDTDTDKTCSTLCPLINRCFHYNCTPKIVKINGEIKVILVGHYLKGPLIRESTSKHQKRGPAIQANSELLLPLDSDLPYSVSKQDWKQRKIRTRKHQPVSSQHSNKNSEKNKSDQSNTQTPTLLTLFYDSSAPPLPLQVLTEEEVKVKERVREKSKTKSRNQGRRSSRRRDISD